MSFFRDDVTPLNAANLNQLAPLASPNFTGTPRAPTPAANTNTTQIATTAMVQARVSQVQVNSLSIGNVSTGPANAVIRGTAPNQVLDLTIPEGGGAGGIQTRSFTDWNWAGCSIAIRANVNNAAQRFGTVHPSGTQQVTTGMLSTAGVTIMSPVWGSTMAYAKVVNISAASVTINVGPYSIVLPAREWVEIFIEGNRHTMIASANATLP